MKKFIFAALTLFSLVANAGYETGAANGVLRIPSGGGRPKFGSINIASSTVVGSSVLAIANGGTGQAAKTAAFDALSPNTTKGDIAIHNGTNNIRVAVGTDGFGIVADSTAASGLAYSSLAPVGTIVMYGGSAAPTGWLLLDGSSLLRAGTYANLFAVLGTTYGAADGTHFTLPDMRGVFARGAGSQVISAITYTGTRGTTQGDIMQGHIHQFTEYVVLGGGGSPQASASLTNASTISTGSPVTDGVNGTPRTGAETRPANITLSYMIKY